ncbi:low affinity immunoglobulin gamma Fc region receptor III-like isoform X2 [Larimichthys crocea]|uniref:low affinity immunoglobulin gamma Fc region receptor III-like isoform X1 n=1 Tax=Larimichthys crocea TaxID=215358 RepID=UPI000F5FFD82|nr:low affinity immunoglobulin gamma Fc region receptor III-like isoform X1 [Larimichthys crocea]XP_027143419.1 low affinity immunoglobulin gamma Fc region receptor III-like isoform X2 [Larimichthys crocea]
MEVTALCIRLLMNVLFLLCDQKVDSVSLRVEPNKLQFFQYDPVTLSCEGWSGWKVAHKVKKDSQCKTTTCIIKNVYLEDGGEYWCEDENGERSNSINITVTDGSVILESPALPVTEGDVVTLRCRNSKASSNLLTDFYKDGVLNRNSSTGEINIHSVSKSDEGLYKCKTSDGGESAESRLTVRDLHHQEKNNNGPSSGSTPWIIVTVLLMILLLVVGLRHYGRAYYDRVLLYLSRLKPASGSEGQTVQVEASAAGEDKPIYATVRKNKKKKDEGELLSSPVYYTLGEDETQQPAEPVTDAFYALATGVTNQPLTEDTYATIT